MPISLSSELAPVATEGSAFFDADGLHAELGSLKCRGRSREAKGNHQRSFEGFGVDSPRVVFTPSVDVQIVRAW
uniref:Transposase n=1 Tax=Panagrellus redivivus TaxID=6233 RepID=A0A7E4UZ37_PANRE